MEPVDISDCLVEAQEWCCAVCERREDDILCDIERAREWCEEVLHCRYSELRRRILDARDWAQAIQSDRADDIRVAITGAMAWLSSVGYSIPEECERIQPSTVTLPMAERPLVAVPTVDQARNLSQALPVREVIPEPPKESLFYESPTTPAHYDAPADVWIDPEDGPKYLSPAPGETIADFRQRVKDAAAMEAAGGNVPGWMKLAKEASTEALKLTAGGVELPHLPNVLSIGKFLFDPAKIAEAMIGGAASMLDKLKPMAEEFASKLDRS